MLVQVVRVFVLARVTVKSLKSLPGMEGCQLPPDNTLMNSNVYSTAETVLLAWITAHYHKVCHSGCHLTFLIKPFGCVMSAKAVQLPGVTCKGLHQAETV